MENKTEKTFLIVGAGLSGLNLARDLASVGNIKIFEKSRGTLGRISSRRFGDRELLKGVQSFECRSEGFKKFISNFISPEMLHENKVKIDESFRRRLKDHFKPIDVQLSYRVTGINESGDGNRLIVKYEDLNQGESRDTEVDFAVLSGPVPQMLELLPQAIKDQHENELKHLESIEYDQQVVVIVNQHDDFDLFDKDHQFECIHHAQSGQKVYFLTNAQVQFHSKPEALGYIGKRVGLGADDLKDPRFHVHFWKYANCKNPLEQTSCSLGHNILFIGDAFAGGGLEGAWASSEQLSKKVLEKDND